MKCFCWRRRKNCKGFGKGEKWTRNGQGCKPYTLSLVPWPGSERCTKAVGVRLWRQGKPRVGPLQIMSRFSSLPGLQTAEILLQESTGKCENTHVKITHYTDCKVLALYKLWEPQGTISGSLYPSKFPPCFKCSLICALSQELLTKVNWLWKSQCFQQNHRFKGFMLVTGLWEHCHSDRGMSGCSPEMFPEHLRPVSNPRAIPQSAMEPLHQRHHCRWKKLFGFRSLSLFLFIIFPYMWC